MRAEGEVVLAGWTRRDTAEALKVLVEGYSDEQAAQELGFSIDDWMDLRAAAESEEGARERAKSDEAVFGGFKVRQQARLRALERMSGGDRAPATAEVSCVRASAEIDLQTLKVGQDVGVYRREPDRQEIGVAARALEGMDSKERRAWFEADRARFYKLRSERDGVPFLEVETEGRWGRSSAELAGAARGEVDDSC